MSEKSLYKTKPNGDIYVSANEVHDYNEKRRFETGAQRDSNVGKLRYDLIPAVALRRWATLMMLGAEKYGDRNWEKGMPVSVYVESLLRHVYAFIEGNTSEDHLAAILFNAGAIQFVEEECKMGRLPSSLLDAGASKLVVDN